MNFDMLPNEISNWNDYPNKIKFFSVHFLLNQDINNIERTTYDFLEFMGDCGGLLEILMFIFGMISAPVAHKKLKAIITNKMFILS